MSNSPTLPPATGLQRTPTPVYGLPQESDARLQSALAASARAEASLNGLFRSIQHLGNGLGGARDANESLTHELEALRDMLGAANEQHMAFEQKVALLEQALDRARKNAAEERAFLIDQQDNFIAILMDEQEVALRRRDSELEALRGPISELERSEPVAATIASPVALASPAPMRPEGSSPPAHSEPFSVPPPSDSERTEHAELERTARKLAEDRERARATLQRLRAQRDDAQSMVSRIRKERDEALQQVHRLKSELGGPRISTRPPSADTRRDSTPLEIPPAPNDLLTLDGLELEARLGQPTTPSQQSLTSNGSQPPLPPPSSAKREPAISSVLRPPRSNPHASMAPISSRLTPAPSRLSPPPGRQSPPPEELRRALTTPPAVSIPSSRPALKQKPDASTRPLVGYSISGEVEAEHLEGVRLSSKPPPGSAQR